MRMRHSYFLIAGLTSCAAGPASAPPSAPPAAASALPAAVQTAPPATPALVAASFEGLRVGPSTHNLIRNASFDGPISLPWMPSFTAPAQGEADVQSGAYCLNVAGAGANPWDAQMRHRQMVIRKGHKYSVRFKVGATRPLSISAKVGMSGAPYRSYWQTAVTLDGTPQVVESSFEMTQPDDATAELALHVGGKRAGRQAPFSVCIDDVVLEDPAFDPPPPPAPPPPVPEVLVNQVGYLPFAEKIAVARTDATSPLGWSLADATGAVVASGTTVTHGMDAASGDRVQTIDFSSFTKAGHGYTVRAGEGAASHPFDIAPGVYRALKYDALAVFYQLRSGVAITMPYAGDARWTHPLGHPGDRSVRCAPDSGCDYSLDVSGGWYDAGDQGKYVVNGGISVWTLLDQYERAQHLGRSVGDFGDGKMNIPENHNGVPDLLDEARWELEFLMKMQVPEGHPLAGMAHHKIHDESWTGLGTSPDRDPIPRYLRPVSTAATLNLAANTAQCARVWKAVDRPFSDRCLRSARRAWQAAVAHPAMYIPPTDSMGGGAYEDDQVADEFYWAAAELWITTGEGAFRDFVLHSPLRDVVPSEVDDRQTTSQTWQHTAPLGTISLAVVPMDWTAEERAPARAAIVKAADAFLEIERSSGYRVSFRPGESGLPWGSNAFPVNNAIELGLAYDFTKAAKYADGVVNALSYILGRNPLDQSYVTGYGARPLENPHHRFWARQADAAFPGPPPGVLSGGPNSHFQDPYVRAAGLRGCPPLKCFADNIEAYSVNEEAINWNAALAWTAAFLDDYGASRHSSSSPARSSVTSD
jgi:endoglucanase